MEKHSDIPKEKELLKSLEDLVDGRDTGQKETGSFLAFCARLLSVKPKADPDFKLSLEQDLLEKHQAHLVRGGNSSVDNALNVLGRGLHGWVAAAKEALFTPKPLKRLAFGGVPVLVIVLAVIIAVGNPRVDIARAVEIMERDPHISALIETYGLSVGHVKMWGNLGYILLDRDPDFEDLEVTIIVDLERKLVWKIVAQEGRVLSKREITGYLDDREAHWADKKKALAAEAERQGMTFLEYITHLKKEGAAKLEEKAAAKGMTPEEYKAQLADEKAAKVEAYVAAFAEKSERMGMTPEEYKAYLVEKKAGKVESYLEEKGSMRK